MSWLNRIKSTASNALSRVRRVASSVIPESIQRRVNDFGNWLTDRVGPEQTSQVLNEIVKHVRMKYPPRQSFKVEESESALRNFTRVYTINGIERYDAESFLDGARENITRVLRNNRGTKVKLFFKCYMKRDTILEELIIKPFAFYSDLEVNLDGTDERELYDRMVERIIEKIAILQTRGTGWRFHSVIKLELHTVRYNPLRGETWIPLPKELANKKAIINMKNIENRCFLWCILRALNPKDSHPERLDKDLMNKENTLNMEGIEYPVSLKDINKFEKQNPTISIIVFGYDQKNVYPLRISDNTDREHKIRLILIEQYEVKHYCLVKDLSRLLSSQVSKCKGKYYFCDYCLNPFLCKKSLDKHLEYCGKYEAVKIKMPDKGTMLKFLKDRKKVPFIIYADFESFIKPLQSCEPDPEKSYTNQYQKYEPSSFCYYIKCFDDEVYKPKLVSYTGDDAAQKFVEMLEEDIKIITNIPEKKMIFGKEDLNDLKRKLDVGYVKKNSMIIKIIRSETIVILLVGIEEPHTIHVILTIENLWCSITLVVMIATYL